MVDLKLNSPENQKVDKCWLRIIANILTDFQGAEILQIRQPFKHQNAVDDVIGVVHFTKAFLIDLLAQRLKAPVAEHARVQKILIDRGQLIF